MLFQLLELVDLLLQGTLSFAHLVFAELDSLRQVLHLLLQVPVHLVELILRLAVCINQRLFRLSCLLVAPQLVKTLLELSLLLTSHFHLLILLVPLLRKVLTSVGSDIVVWVLQQIQLHLQGRMEVFEVQLRAGTLALGSAQLRLEGLNFLLPVLSLLFVILVFKFTVLACF